MSELYDYGEIIENESIGQGNESIGPEIELNMNTGDVSGNYNDTMFEAYNSDYYNNSCTNICDLNNSNDTIENYNLNEMITIGVTDEFNKYSFCLNSSNNLYKELDTKFSRMKDHILEQFKSSDVFIDSLDITNHEMDPLDYRTLLNQNLIKDLDDNELYKELGINYKELSKTIDSVKEKCCSNFKTLQCLEKIIHNEIDKLDKDSIKLLSIV